MMNKWYFLLLILTTFKKVPPPNPFNDESYVAEFISWACYHLPMQVLKQKNTLEKFMANAEANLEPRQVSTMELYGLTVFAKNPSWIFDWVLNTPL